MIGGLLDKLEDLDLYDSSLIVFTSDHGEEFWDNGGCEHGHTVHEELIRVPLIVKPPAGAASAAGVRSCRVSTVAITPTILGLSGVGHSTSSFSVAELPLTDEQCEDATVQVSSLRRSEEREALMFGDWKYVRFALSGREQLFNTRDDPGDSLDLAGARSELVVEARRILDQLSRSSLLLKEELGVGETELNDESSEAIEILRSLGYLQ